MPPDPGSILALVKSIGEAARVVWDATDKAFELEREEQGALKDLRKAVESLKSDIVVYGILVTTMVNDTYPNGLEPLTLFIQRREGGKEVMENLEGAFKLTRLLLEEGPSHGVTINPSGSKKSRRALGFVLNALNPTFLPGQRHERISDLRDATYEMNFCQQNNKRAFKLMWKLYVIFQQHNNLHPSIVNVGNIEDRVGHALDSFVDAFRAHPFTVSQLKHGKDDPSTIALNHDYEAATQYEQFARRIAKAWVEDWVREDGGQIWDFCALQILLLELLWSGTIEQLKVHHAYSADDPERSEFEEAVEDLDRELQEAITCSKQHRFVIAFIGMAKAGKSLFLNALIGRPILPSDKLPSTAWPCRVRHVEGQTIPELQFQAEPFLVALKKLQAYQYGRKMQAYQPPPENMFEALLSAAPSEPSEEETLLRTIHSQWVNLHATTRDNLLKFEKPGFTLPQSASGEQDVGNLVSFMCC